MVLESYLCYILESINQSHEDENEDEKLEVCRSVL